MLTTFSQLFHIIVTCGQKSNVNGRIKLEPITTCHLNFVVKALLKCCGCNTHQKFPKQTNYPKSPN